MRTHGAGWTQTAAREVKPAISCGRPASSDKRRSERRSGDYHVYKREVDRRRSRHEVQTQADHCNDTEAHNTRGASAAPHSQESARNAANETEAVRENREQKNPIRPTTQMNRVLSPVLTLDRWKFTITSPCGMAGSGRFMVYRTRREEKEGNLCVRHGDQSATAAAQSLWDTQNGNTQSKA